MQKTKIEYLDYSWNPLAMRCTPCSPGCLFCWHLKMAKRLANNPMIPIEEQVAYHNEGQPILTHRLNDPLNIRKPARIGVQFMGDLFHESVDIQHQHKIFQVIGQCPQHSFFILTKRPQNIERVIKWHWQADTAPNNLWLGVTVCNRAEADEKIPILLQIPGFKKWISIEPILGPVLLSNYGTGSQINWVVAGSETGPGARPADNEWFRSIRDQCRNAGVPFFMKQTTGPMPDDLMIREYPELKEES